MIRFFGLDGNHLFIGLVALVESFAQLLYLERFPDCFFFSSAVQVEELEGDDNKVWCFCQEPEHGYVLKNHFFEKQKENVFLWSSVVSVLDIYPDWS